MTEPTWAAIASGATFQALVMRLIFFEDAGASLFGRPGKDGGQDARSGDRSLVYQAKYHADGTGASAIRDAKEEAQKIAEYRQPGHRRAQQWSGVTRWCLVTNALFNPTDKQRWDTEVVPLFADQGLEADYWERAKLEALLGKYPDVLRSFFGGETRAFLSLPEIRARLPEEEPFLRRDRLGTFCGRSTELAAVEEFLGSQQLFLLIHGAGGTGKTRLLLEAGECAAARRWQVLWANVASMSASGAWFEGVPNNRQTLLLVDDPSDATLLQRLAEQLGGHVAQPATWKVAVAVRSPKDQVLRFLRGARMVPRVRELPMDRLREADAGAMCVDLLAVGKFSTLSAEARGEMARELIKRSGCYPVWIALAVYLIEEHGDLAKVAFTSRALAAQYLQEIEESQSEIPREDLRELLRWIALVGPVNRNDATTLKLLGERAHLEGPVAVKRQLAVLVERHVLSQRGARDRFVELKPDVLRDRVLMDWLAANVGALTTVPSDAAVAMSSSLFDAAVAGPLSALDRSTLVSIGRTELLLRLTGYDVPLLGAFFQGLIEVAQTLTASKRLALLDTLESVALVRPEETARVIGLLRQNPVTEDRQEGIFGERVITPEDVTLGLGWPLFHAAMGADNEARCETVLRELCAVVREEAALVARSGRSLPNDGKRAAALVVRVLEGGPQFWNDFDAAGRTLGLELLNDLSSSPPTTADAALLKALVEPVLAVERQQTWADERALHVQTFVIGDEHPGWAARAALLQRTKELISTEGTPNESRVALWHIFAEGHRDVSRVCRREEPQARLYRSLLDDLSWTLEVLRGRAAAAVAELSAAREVWRWHRSGSDAVLRASADELDALYSANAIAGEFEGLLDDYDLRAQEAKGVAKAAELGQAATVGDITVFIDRAVTFLGHERELYRLNGVALALGEREHPHEAVKAFVRGCLKNPEVTAYGNFGIVVASGWVSARRKLDAPSEVVSLVRELLALCGSESQRENLLIHLYSNVTRHSNLGPVSPEELALFRTESAPFLDGDRSPVFVRALALDAAYDWATLGPLLERLLRRSRPELLVRQTRALIDGVYWAVAADGTTPPPKLSQWLLDQLLILPDLGDIGDNAQWYLEEILKRTERAPLPWLPKALRIRRDGEADATRPRGFRAISHHARLSKYVAPVTAANMQNADIAQSVEALLGYVDDNGSIGFYLPQIIRDIDPEGLIAPVAVARMLGEQSDPKGVRRLARTASGYGEGTKPWRIIAKPAIVASGPPGTEARRSVFAALGERGIRTWSSDLGAVASIFVSAVKDGRVALESESDADVRTFWKWRLEIAEAELREEEERAKEERGE